MNPLAPARTLAAAVALIGLGALGAVGAAVAFVRLGSAGHLHPESVAPSAPVALVLGAQVHPDGTPSSFLAARLDLAHRLWRAGVVRVLLLSGDGGAPEYDEPAAMRAYLLAAGVPDDRLVLDRYGLDTYDSAFRARAVFGVEELLVVTQAYHLPRAVATCRALGIRAEGVGDVSVRRFGGAWLQGAVRDQVACVKTVLDLATRRQPVLGPPLSDVREALTLS
jgi:vancomycin permeability regulator SanA